MEKSNIYLTYKSPMSINFDSSDVIIIEIILSNRVNLVEMIMMMNRTLFQISLSFSYLFFAISSSIWFVFNSPSLIESFITFGEKSAFS
jgi:hypothetical protein